MLRNLSWGAADILMAYARGEKPPYGFSKELDIKDNADGPVSAADLAVNSWLLEGFKNYYPSVDWIVLSEENAKGRSVDDVYKNNEWVWVLDPLDGTKDFLQGTGEYAVHLALVKDHTPIIGVVVIPELDELWFGVVGHGAWCENRLKKKKDVQFSNRGEISKMILLASRNHRDKRLSQLIDKISFASIKGVGSVGCKVATILRGEADVYISLSGKTSPKDWDMAAPEALLKAAGGEFSHANGKPLVYMQKDLNQAGCLIASSGSKHKLLCELIFNAMKYIDPMFEV